MSLVVQIVSREGDVNTQAVGFEGLRMPALAGKTYRIVDTDNPGATIVAKIRKDGDDLIVDLLAARRSVVLEDFYFVCRFDFRSCALDLEPFGADSGQKIDGDELATGREDDGTLLVWTTSAPAPDAGDANVAAAQSAVPADNGDRGPAPLETRESFAGRWAMIGGLGVGVLALAGSGGGSDAVASDTTNGGSNSDNTPPATPTITSAQLFQTSTPVVSGTAEPGSTITLTVDKGGSGSLVVFSGVADAAGNWQIDMSSQQPDSGTLGAQGLPVGQSSPVSVTATDAQGNTSTALAADISIQPLATGNAATVTAVVSSASSPVDSDGNALSVSGLNLAPGVVERNGHTNDASPDIAGRLDGPLATGAIVVVVRNGIEIGPATINGLDWTFSDSNVPEGEQRYSAVVRNADGSVTLLSPEYLVNVDGTPPAQPGLQTVAGDSTISTAEAQLGVVLAGSAQAARVLVSVGSLQRVVEVDANGNYSTVLAATELPPRGTHTFSVQAIDDYGNLSTATTQSVVVQASNTNDSDVSVVVRSATDNVASETGALSSGATSNDNSPLLTGSVGGALLPGQVLVVSDNGAVVGRANVVGTTWTFQAAGLGDGTHSFTASVVQADGSVIATTARSFDLTVDTSAPAQPIFDPVEGNSVVTEAEAADGIQLTGQGEAGATVQATWNNTVVTNLVDASGSWNLEFASLPAGTDYGVNSFRVVQTDEAGNTSSARVRVVWLELPDLISSGDNIDGLDALAGGDSVNSDSVNATAGTSADGGTIGILDDLQQGGLSLI